MGLVTLFVACFAPTAVAGLLLPLVYRQKPDILFILAMSAASPITIILVGSMMLTPTLLPVGIIFGLACLISPWDLTYLAVYYILVGTYLCGFAFQLTLMVE